VQELAFTLANGIAYVEAALSAGLDVDTFGPQLSFFFNAHNNFFEEVAKFRAARRLWARIMKSRFGAKRDDTMKLRFHAQTGGSTLTAQQADNNVVRVTLQALAAVLGGCQSLHTNARDEALALPTERSATLALRTQQVIAHESRVADTIDPLGGSYFVEHLTNEMEQRAAALIEQIDAIGGAIKAIEQKFYQNEITKSAYLYQVAIEKKNRIIVGVNDFVSEETNAPELMQVDDALSKKQITRLREMKERRNDTEVRSNLASLRAAAKTRQNVIPFILSCVEAYATVGEISDALRDVWGEYKE
jgi:methylmalonyl-CoA mutase N-terminal domain/subunit